MSLLPVSRLMPPGSSMHWLTLFLGLSVSSKAFAAAPTVTVSKGKIQGAVCENGGANSCQYPMPNLPLVFSASQPSESAFSKVHSW